MLWNNALVSAVNARSYDAARSDSTWWGRRVENAVGAHLLEHLRGSPYQLCSWKHRAHEVDYVIAGLRGVLGIEVKSGRLRRSDDRGIEAFRQRHPHARVLIVGGSGMPLDEFLGSNMVRLWG